MSIVQMINVKLAIVEFLRLSYELIAATFSLLCRNVTTMLPNGICVGIYELGMNPSRAIFAVCQTWPPHPTTLTPGDGSQVPGSSSSTQHRSSSHPPLYVKISPTELDTYCSRIAGTPSQFFSSPKSSTEPLRCHNSPDRLSALHPRFWLRKIATSSCCSSRSRNTCTASRQHLQPPRKFDVRSQVSRKSASLAKHVKSQQHQYKYQW